MGEGTAQPAALAPGPRQPLQAQPPPPASKLGSVPHVGFPQLAPGYYALASQPVETHEHLQQAPEKSPLPNAASPLVTFPISAPSPMRSSEGLQHRLAATEGRARQPAMSASVAAAPAGAAAAGPGGQAGQLGNATMAEPLHSRSLAPAIQDGTLDLHGNGTLVHSSSITAPSPLPEPLWMGTEHSNGNLSLAGLLG